MPAGDAIVGHVVTFGRVLREAGLEIGPGRLTDSMRALDAVDLASRDDVYFALRQTLVSRRDELALFDRAFDAWFLGNLSGGAGTITGLTDPYDGAAATYQFAPGSVPRWQPLASSAAASGRLWKLSMVWDRVA